MALQELTIQRREGTGKQIAKRLRRQGVVPAIVYGGPKTEPVTVDPKAVLRMIAGHAGTTQLLTLKMDGDGGSRLAIIRAMQFDPVTERPLISGVDDDTPREQDADADAATTKDTDAATDAGPLTDEGGFDDPKVVDPATGTPLDADRTTEDHPAESAAPVVASVPAAAVAAAAGPSPDKLFDQDDARGFQERWRDVQLRFVDSPKDAAGDAAKLVDEAVERLTARLRAQREGLHRDTEDTEQLRVQLRGYRDILNRILGL